MTNVTDMLPDAFSSKQVANMYRQNYKKSMTSREVRSCSRKLEMKGMILVGCVADCTTLCRTN
jgi:hypothetical protein